MLDSSHKTIAPLVVLKVEKGLHAFVVDEAAGARVALWQIAFSGWVTLSARKWVISRLFRTFCATRAEGQIPAVNRSRLATWTQNGWGDNPLRPQNRTFPTPCDHRLLSGCSIAQKVRKSPFLARAEGRAKRACDRATQRCHRAAMKPRSDLTWDR